MKSSHPRPPANPVGDITFPEQLPVSARWQEIATAIQDHQVVVVCGETGSGKTTQLPKIALKLGRGRGAGGKGWIGHTQPRRVAASSVAKRIAQELQSSLGEIVGYKVRFQDKLQPGASVKLMTDGILLAETQSDPLLKAYDTIIIDEAHERSLNIDFLLGYLRQLLPRRPDLKVIVTSATIDAERFAQHFAGPQGPAPVIQVSGRTFPVDMWWRPFQETREHGLPQAIAEAIDELWHHGDGDVLVFLPGEREIRDTAEYLARHHPPGVEVLPLYARLSQAEQDRVFEPHGQRRIILATNVAETSLTVPGIRYVVDAGTARVKRYSYRQKVEQLQVEAVSQAAASQRAGRCGRVQHGICVRLYDELDFQSRPRFTDPEILRSSLAGVILRMKSLSLGKVEDFPFIDAPLKRAVTDGYQLLHELGAATEEGELSDLGSELARLPLDPRIGRMLLEARHRQALQEVLVVASAMSVQDVRDRPAELAAQADLAHRRFDDEKSEFKGWVRLWQWLEQLREPHEVDGAAVHKLSKRQQEQTLRDAFISPRRVREWRDVHTQLMATVKDAGWRLNGSPATDEQFHLSILAGLLGNIGCKLDEGEAYLGARGIKFLRHPGVHLSKRPGRWVMAAELVETTRLYARGMAPIDPAWLPGLAKHLIKLQYLDPHWERKQGEVVVRERATLYGIVLYSDKKVNYGKIDPVVSREIFIREALVAGDTDARWPFLQHNRKVIERVRELEHKSRRQDVLVDDALIEAFYEQHLPEDVVGVSSLDKALKARGAQDTQFLRLSQEDLMRHEASGVTTEAFPKLIRLGGIDCAASYLHAPGETRDGLTVQIPVYALNQVLETRCEWLVPGMLKDKVLSLIKTLPQRPRSRMVPLPQWAQQFCDQVMSSGQFGQGGLMDALLQEVKEHTQIPVLMTDFKLEQLSPHLLMNLLLVDEHGRQLAMGRNLPSLKAQWGGQARSAFQGLAALRMASPKASQASDAKPAKADPGHGPAVQTAKAPTTLAPKKAVATSTDAQLLDAAQRYTEWTFGPLPELMELQQGQHRLYGYPAVVDHKTGVALEVFDEPAVAEQKHRAGLRRLLMLHLKDAIKVLERQLPDWQKLGALYMPLGSVDELRQQILNVALDRAFLSEPLPRDAASFAARVQEGRGRWVLIAQEVARLALQILTQWSAALRKLRDLRADKATNEDVTQQLNRLVGPHFLQTASWSAMAHWPRYLQAVVLRLDKWRADPVRDAARLAELKPIENRWLKARSDRKGVADRRLEDFGWMLEEWRVGLFAQELKTAHPVSGKRLEKVWQEMQR